MTNTKIARATKATKALCVALTLALGISAVGAIATPNVAEAKNGRNAAIAAGVIFGLAAGAAIASQSSGVQVKHHYHGQRRHYAPRRYHHTRVCERQRYWNGYAHRWEVKRVCWHR